jgi:hypothetical protein
MAEKVSDLLLIVSVFQGHSYASCSSLGQQAHRAKSGNRQTGQIRRRRNLYFIVSETSARKPGGVGKADIQ